MAVAIATNYNLSYSTITIECDSGISWGTVKFRTLMTLSQSRNIHAHGNVENETDLQISGPTECYIMNNNLSNFQFSSIIYEINFENNLNLIIDENNLCGLPSSLFQYIYSHNNTNTNNYLLKYLIDNEYLSNINCQYLTLQGYLTPSFEPTITRNNNKININYGPTNLVNFKRYMYANNMNFDRYTEYSSLAHILDYDGSAGTIDKFSRWHYGGQRVYDRGKMYADYGWFFQDKINTNNIPYIPTSIFTNYNLDLHNLYFLCYDENNHPVDGWYLYNGTITRTLTSPTPTTTITIDVDEWKTLAGNDYINYELISTSPSYIYRPSISLIGDKTADEIVIPEGNTDVLQYILGEGINRQFVPKTLKVNAPCLYSGVAVIQKTWLTFNTYTSTEWNSGFHFKGEQWNNIGSPFAYLNGITSSTGDRKMLYTFEPADAGTYVNIFSLINTGFEVKDSDNNEYIAKTDILADYRHYYDDNVGSLWYFGTSIVTSTDRHAYPDAGSVDYLTYVLRPQDTKFLRYYREKKYLRNVELFSDRYHYPQETVDFCDRSWEGRTIGTPTSTNEGIVPLGTWREYLGLYLGESIPFLHITETIVPPSEILGVPQYDKQVNTSDTLKYGTVASASLSFTLNKPVNDCMALNNQLLVLFYDFKNTDEWERLGFFRIDNIEALDEYSTSLLAHDETYKLNKYVDDFLETYTQSTTLDLFYRDLLDYCDCFYDTHQPIIHNGNINMSNVYHAVKTTGVQVAHYIAILVPGFIHTNIDGDIVLSQYQIVDNNLTISDYTNLVYCAYNTDMINKVKIASNNAVKGESRGSGENVYFLADDPLLSELQTTEYFNDLADGILAYYTTIPAYRPATIDFLILPRSLAIGDIVNLTTPKNENYAVIIMRMSITSSGIQVQSFGTQKYPVEAESNSEFVNLINDMGEITGDVTNIREAQQTMAAAIAENAEHISQNTTSISSIITKNTQQDNAISAVQTQANGFGVTVSNNLASIVLNGTVNNIATKNYVDAGDAATLNSAKAYADTIGLVYDYGTLTYNITNSQSATQYSADVIWIGDREHKFGIFVPQRADTTHDMWKLMNATGYYFSGGTWALMYNATYRYN